MRPNKASNGAEFLVGVSTGSNMICFRWCGMLVCNADQCKLWKNVHFLPRLLDRFFYCRLFCFNLLSSSSNCRKVSQSTPSFPSHRSMCRIVQTWSCNIMSSIFLSYTLLHVIQRKGRGSTTSRICMSSLVVQKQVVTSLRVTEESKHAVGTTVYALHHRKDPVVEKALALTRLTRSRSL